MANIIYFNWMDNPDNPSENVSLLLLLGMKLKKTAAKRIAQQKKELSLAVILSFTVLLFLITHAPR